MKDEPPPKGTSIQNYDQEAARLNRKANELYRTGTYAELDVYHHILIIAPDTGRTWRLGRVRWPKGTAKKKHLEDHIPDTRHQLPWNCRFGPLEDDRSFFPKWLWSEYDNHADIVKRNKWALENSEVFWNETWDATSKRVSEYLEEADSRGSSDDEFFYDASSNVADF
jgi:hypothetical protein